MFPKSIIKAAVVSVAAVSAAFAQNDQVQPPLDVSGLKEAVHSGRDDQPRVNADWYNFAARGYAEQGARGSYYPSVDLSSRIGREDRDTPLIDIGDSGY